MLEFLSKRYFLKIFNINLDKYLWIVYTNLASAGSNN